MLRKIDIGEDKNVFIPDPKAASQPQMNFMAEELAKSADEAISDAKKLVWDRWIGSEPLITTHLDDKGHAYLFSLSETLKNKVILFDIWDYTLLPCRRALAYVQEWHKRYGNSGLVTIGVHSPAFEFGKDKKHIQDAIKALSIQYPVVMDNNFEIWKCFENRYWPRRVVVDSSGKTQIDISGEGFYPETEKHIQVLLRELSPGLPCPSVMKPLLPIDEPDAVLPTVTEEIFLGLKKKPRFGSPQVPNQANEEITFKDLSNGSYVPEILYLEGPWITTQDSMFTSPAHKGELKITVRFTGTDVFIVAAAKPKNPMDISQGNRPQIFINKKQMAVEHLAEDSTLNEYRRCVAIVKDPRLYHIATKLDAGTHDLTLIIDNSGSDCFELFGIFFESRQ